MTFSSMANRDPFGAEKVEGRRQEAEGRGQQAERRGQEAGDRQR